jgi:ATP-dependent Zn protease
MSNERKDQGQGASPIIVGESRTPRRAWIVWLAVLGAIVLLMLFKERMDSPAETISQYRFEQLVDAGQITHATVNYDPQNPALNEVVGKYYKTEGDAKTEVPFRAVIRLTGSLERKLLNMPEVEPRQPNALLLNIAASVLPFLLIAALIWFFFIRQIKKATRTSPSAAEVNARALEQQERFDRILDKWEDQARRMDAVLEKMEKR